MGCRCNERRAAIVLAASSLARGNVSAAVKSTAYVGRTMIEDVRSGDLRRAVSHRLMLLRAGARR